MDAEKYKKYLKKIHVDTCYDNARNLLLIEIALRLNEIAENLKGDGQDG